MSAKQVLKRQENIVYMQGWTTCLGFLVSRTSHHVQAFIFFGGGGGNDV